MRPLSLKTRIPELLLLALMLYLGNPAVALLAAATVTLILNRQAPPLPENWGQISLQVAIVLLGLKLNAAELFKISAEYSLVVTGYVLFTLAAGLAMGTVLFSDKKCSQLISSGTAICGGTTIASLSPIIKARAEQTGVVLTLIFLLNAIALFTFPHIGKYFAMSQEQFGVWVALAIHDTSSVVATASIYGNEAAKIATTVKLGRTLLLIPLLLVFSVLQHKKDTRVEFPLFIALFIGTACIGSFVTLPEIVISTASMLSKMLLVFALYCIGSEITRTTLGLLRGRVLVHGVLLWLLVAPLSLFVVLNY
ncbi:MAG: putative sulfate exporter family transporter [Pseudomonadales bacterium]|nr:putative sulfate exporter family transporter [Pseudomonadales bacterium]